MRIENFYKKNLYQHFKTSFETTKQGYQAQQAVAFICEEFLGIRADARIDEIKILSYSEKTLSRILFDAKLAFSLNGEFHVLHIQQFTDDNDILKVEEYAI